jgi:hypothetical protein
MHSISKEYLSDCKPGKGECPPIVITRSTKTQKVIVGFQITPSRTSLALFDSGYIFQIASFNNPGPLRKGFLLEGNIPALELTSLPDGKYYVYLMGSDTEGIYELNLSTDK